MQTLEALIDPIRRSPPRMEAASCCDARLNSNRIDGANFIRKWHLNKRPNSSTARWSCIRPPAIANHWPIPPETLAAVPVRMLDFVENGKRPQHRECWSRWRGTMRNSDCQTRSTVICTHICIRPAMNQRQWVLKKCASKTGEELKDQRNSPNRRIDLVKPTKQRFVERVLRLYEQSASLQCIGQYVGGWCKWVVSGSGILTEVSQSSGSHRAG